MIEEVKGLVDEGVPWEKLEFLGLEYRYVADYLQDRIRNQNDLIQKLASAISQFAKRQDSWFRRMERNGHVIHWIERGDFNAAMKTVAMGDSVR
jgi:tRNA dimethylallyltransferase